MDKNDAIKLSKRYLGKLHDSGIEVLSAYLFGSYAKGGFTDDSDIDLALVLPDNQYSFDTDVKLMTLRRGDETLIETHTFTQKQFVAITPIVSQIKQYGIRI
jgi:predicted nucleotidyltransferase